MSCRNSPRPGLAARAALGLWAVSLARAWPRTGQAQVSPEESARKLEPAEGLKTTLWASVPMVFNSTNMDIDSRGRLWVVEGLKFRAGELKVSAR